MNELKNTFLYYVSKAWPFLLLVFAPVQSAMIVIFLLVVIDTILGVLAAMKEKYKITSRSLRRSVPKLFVYVFSAVFFFLIERYLFNFDVQEAGMMTYPITKVVIALIGVIEGKSIFENLYRLTKIDFLKIMIDKLQLLNKEMQPANDKDKEDVHTGKNRE